MSIFTLSTIWHRGELITLLFFLLVFGVYETNSALLPPLYYGKSVLSRFIAHLEDCESFRNEIIC